MHPRDRRIDMPHTPIEESSPISFTCSSSSKWKFDVFLSFAGEDTRLNFTDHLYDALIRSGVRCFRDDKGIERGQVIKQQLLEAIRDSLCAVVVLSKNYANSTWCLDELQEILESRKEFGGQVFPVFYGVDPSDVRYQRNSFGKALTKHEKRFKNSKDKVQKWRDALSQVSNLSGLDTTSRHETEVIQDIVEAVWDTLCSNLPSYDDNLVGIESRMVQINSLLEIEADGMRFVGIWGMGGVGKTTLARVVFERISGQFEMSCFLANVREISERQGLVSLQKDILLQLNKGKKIRDEHSVKIILNGLFRNKKVLLVLDDVSHESQLENLASPKWFGSRSRVIITTRNLHLLKSQGVHGIYEVRPMEKDESLQLFSKKAFKKDHPEDDYFVLSETVLKYAGGLPLALYVLGSFLCGRSLLEWEEALERMKQIPNDDIFQILKISYRGLNDEEKTIFLDIACFFNGWKRDEVAQILKSCGLHPTIGINILIERALLIEKKTSDGETILEVHDLLQELARSIVFQESPGHAHGPSRLWNLKDIDEVLKNDKGTEAIQSIVLDSSPLDVPDRFSNQYNGIEVSWERYAFSKMFNLRLLIIRRRLKLRNGLECLSSALRVVQWPFCSLEALPLGTPLNKLVDIRMQHSDVRQLWNGMQIMENLKFVDMSFSENLIETPDFSGVPNLENLILEGCLSLVVVHHSLGELKRLAKVNLCGCTSLEVLPRKLEINSLEKLLLRRCYKVSVLPEFGEGMKTLSSLDVSYAAIGKLPKSFEFLTGLRDLKMRNCGHLVFCPLVLRNMKNLKTLDSSGCSKLLKGQERLNETEVSKEDGVSQNIRTDMSVLNAPLSNQVFSSNLLSLTELDLSACGLSDGSFLEDFSGLSSLVVLNLGANDFVNLHDGWLCNSFRLRFLFLSSCKRLKSLPKLPPQLIRLDAAGCDSMEPLSETQLWNMVSSLDHEYRHRVKYENTLLKHIEQAEYLPQRDFFAIIWGSEIPSWFPNKDYVPSDFYRSKYELIVDIPQHVRASEWSGLAVCIKFQIMPCIFDRFHISWSSKAPEDGQYIRKKWGHEIGVVLKEGPHLCIMVLHLNEKTCWQHLRGHNNNCLHIKFSFHSPCRDMLKIGGCGSRVICKEDLKEWGNTDYLNKSIDTSEVCIPDTALDRTIKIFL